VVASIGTTPASVPHPRGATVASAHQKGGVGKSTSVVLLAAEMHWLSPGLDILVENLDPDLNLTSRWLAHGTSACSTPAPATP
jgi:cellulose biosynthesis protein BcsQ